MDCVFCRVEHQTTVPTVHLNGSPAVNLREDLSAALDALRVAQRKLVEAAPNGRDYYVQAGATQAAMTNHERRCRDLQRMMAEIEEMRDHVQAVLDDYEARRKPYREEAAK